MPVNIYAQARAELAWFEALATVRPVGLSVLTDDLLKQVGSPYESLPPRGTADGDLSYATAQALGRMWADERARKATLGG